MNKIAEENTSNRNTLKSYLSENYKEVLLILSFSLVIAFVQKYYYPYMEIDSDTGGYIRWANENLYGGIRPLGYSIFLKILHSISNSTFFVYIVQYSLYTISQLIFYLTTAYLFRFKNKLFRICYAIVLSIFISAIYATNMMLSDSIFLSLTTIFISINLWFNHKPNTYIFTSILVIGLLTGMIRYIGIVFPILSILNFFLSLKWPKALLASFIIIITSLSYINHVENMTEADQGTRTFSAFGGWQKASNACHVIPYLDLKKPIIESDDYDIQLTDSIIRISYPTLKSKYPPLNTISYDFIWIDSLPLKQIFYRKREQTGWEYYRAWNYMGPVFSNYADEIITHYPYLYFRHFILCNTKRLLYPDNEIFTVYNKDSVTAQQVTTWYNESQYKNAYRIDIARPLLTTIPFTYLCLWLSFAFVIISMANLLIKKHITIGYAPNKQMLIIIIFIFFYSAVSIISSPINARFLMPIRCGIIACIFYYTNLAISIYKKI